MKHTNQTHFELGAPRDSDAGRFSTRHLSALGLQLVDASPQAAVRALLTPGSKMGFFINAHCCNIRQRDPSYAAALERATMLLPDGAGIELAARMGGETLSSNLNGTDLVPRLLVEAAKRGLSVFLFGARPGTAEAAADALIAKIPHLQIAGTRDGFDGAEDADAAVAAINASGADILLVAMGVPRQELWLARHQHRLSARVTLAVGALFDFLAGNVSRAPVLVRKARLEWVWRLAQEPRRLAQRYLIGNVTFLARAAKTVLAQSSANALQRRLLDLALAGSALLFLAPLLLAVMALIRLESPGAVLFRQIRVGKDGRRFEMLKFRSMYLDAEARRAQLLATSDRAGICFKSKADPRITRVGRFIRRFSIDELPQILNVIRGEMSIVGPRPALPEEAAAYPRRALGRLAVKPGITGIWQVSGRADIGFEKMIDMDLAYTKSRTLLLDFMLIALTVRAVFSGRGAY
jgi:exopolysaccharide biosynthesis WecB/TagA/CpsF family protein